ncbi:hypothetical protein [Aureliella helgolandensis]|uniref:Uncharacterized protein n=1 Tax=Aureliella helgolandensis TaxID=2527968 RepID=A0A518G8M0_9BACT|nr:hypothetical protein [Aureliella helgolandensis]QDV24930.1 hypothetical protein Q31a_32520 [Aureliella helgolandensis]
MDWYEWQHWFAAMEWSRLIPELVGKALGFSLGFIVSWYFLFRKRIRELQRFQQGDTDDVLFQAHYLLPVAPSQVQLVFRNVTTKLTVNQLYDNPAARELLRGLTEQTTLNDPLLPTRGTLGFELLNDAAGYAAGALATSPHPKEIWLFCMTCEDRLAVRRRCIRCFLIRQPDLEQFEDWQWVRKQVRVEKPWHWFRLVALHRMARVWQEERSRFARIESDQALPLVDDHFEHRRIVLLSVGLPTSELPVALPFAVDWSQHAAVLQDWKVKLES